MTFMELMELALMAYSMLWTLPVEGSTFFLRISPDSSKKNRSDNWPCRSRMWFFSTTLYSMCLARISNRSSGSFWNISQFFKSRRQVSAVCLSSACMVAKGLAVMGGDDDEEEEEDGILLDSESAMGKRMTNLSKGSISIMTWPNVQVRTSIDKSPLTVMRSLTAAATERVRLVTAIGWGVAI